MRMRKRDRNANIQIEIRKTPIVQLLVVRVEIKNAETVCFRMSDEVWEHNHF